MSSKNYAPRYRNLCKAITQAGMDEVQFAFNCGMTYGYFAEKINGGSDFTPQEYDAMAQKLGAVSPEGIEDLFWGDEAD